MDTIYLIATIRPDWVGGNQPETTAEASPVGAAGAPVIALLRRSMDFKTFWTILVDTGYVTASMNLIIASAAMFSRFLAISVLPSAMGNWVTAQQFTILTVMLV